MTKTSTPQLRFPEFVDKWQEKKLGDISEIITGNTPSTKDQTFYGGNYCFVSPADIKNNRYVSDTQTKLTTEGFSKTRKIPPKSSLFVCIGSTIGKIAQNKFELATNQQINSIIAKSNFNNDFIYLSLNRLSKKIALIAGVQAVPIINKSEFSAIKFNIPSLLEQQKIADFLGEVDEKIEKLEDKKKLLEEYKKGIMQKIFSQQIRFCDENGKSYPDWEEKKLGNILFEPQKEKELNPDNIELLTVKLHCLGVTRSGNFPKSTKRGRPYFKRYKGELLIGRQNFHNGGFGFVTNKANGLIASNAISSYLFNNGFNKNFIYYSISRKDFYRKVDHIIGGTGQKEISRTEFSKLKIKLPVLEEQQKIADFLTLLDNKINQINNKLTQAKLFKKSLLQKMFI